METELPRPCIQLQTFKETCISQMRGLTEILVCFDLLQKCSNIMNDQERAGIIERALNNIIPEIDKTYCMLH